MLRAFDNIIHKIMYILYNIYWLAFVYFAFGICVFLPSFHLHQCFRFNDFNNWKRIFCINTQRKSKDFIQLQVFHMNKWKFELTKWNTQIKRFIYAFSIRFSISTFLLFLSFEFNTVETISKYNLQYSKK